MIGCIQLSATRKNEGWQLVTIDNCLEDDILLDKESTLNNYFQTENLLREITYKRLSNTWFGEPDNGEPAFALGEEYYLDMNEIEIAGFEAICPVTIQNNSLTILNVQRLIIRDENATLYNNDNKIVTSLVHVEYKGYGDAGSVDYRYSKQYNGEKQEILAKPRNTSGKSLLNLNFHFIKNIYRNE